MIFKQTILITFLVLYFMSMDANAVQIIPRQQSSWTCVDYAKDYHASHPNSILLTMSPNHLFRVKSHMVACEVINNGTALRIHDGMLEQEYVYYDWYSVEMWYYHFWLEGETPFRTFDYLYDNRNDILSQYNVTELQNYHMERMAQKSNWHGPSKNS